jgi:hypothetical protein
MYRENSELENSEFRMELEDGFHLNEVVRRRHQDSVGP